MTTMMYPVFSPAHYSSSSDSSSSIGFSYTDSAQPFLVESLPMDASFSFAQSLQHPFLGALQAPLPAAVPEELRCQYSSKRCENRRTNKKSGGLHKFCAVHREKANRNQMRLDHRRRVLKRLAQREQRSNGASTPTSASGGSPSRRRRSSTSRADAADNDEFILHVEDDLDIDLMPLALHSPNAGPNAQSNMIVDPQDLRILEVLLFSDEDQSGSDDGDTLRVAAPARNSECFDRAASLTTTTASKKPASTWPTTTLRL